MKGTSRALQAKSGNTVDEPESSIDNCPSNDISLWQEVQMDISILEFAKFVD